MAASSCSGLLMTVLLFLLLLSPLSSSSVSSTGSNSRRDLTAVQRTDNVNSKRNRIPNCCEMKSRSQCSMNPSCRWCRSQALDDTCFSKAEAWRLPQQVFVCDS